MANLNKKYCNCTGVYVGDPDGTGTCQPLTPTSPDPCPATFWSTAAGWDWGSISANALNWSYALGFLTPPNQNLELQLYQQELERQKRQSQMIMIGMGILLIVIVAIVVARKK